MDKKKYIKIAVSGKGNTHRRDGLELSLNDELAGSKTFTNKSVQPLTSWWSPLVDSQTFMSSGPKVQSAWQRELSPDGCLIFQPFLRTLCYRTFLDQPSGKTTDINSKLQPRPGLSTSPRSALPYGLRLNQLHYMSFTYVQKNIGSLLPP